MSQTSTPNINTTATVSQIEAILLKVGLQQFEDGLTPSVEVLIMTNPGITDEAIVITLDGQAKHAMRGKIGWAVDFLWPFIETYVVQAIQETINTVRATPTPAASPS